MGDKEKLEAQKLVEHKDYLDHILDAIDPNIQLDEDQRRVIVSDQERALVLAGAGTGKTTTMIARVKYLVDKMQVDPSKILVLSFARKNVKELKDRINIDLHIPADVSTFHALGLKYLKKVCHDKGRKCWIVEDRDKYDIFEKYLRTELYTSKERIAEFYESFKDVKYNNRQIFRNFFTEHYAEFDTFGEFLQAFKAQKKYEWGDNLRTIIENAEDKVNADIPRNIKHEWFRSKGEAVISNFLIEHGISYEYEKVYGELSREDVDDTVTIRPDFTLSIGGEDIIVEYFGLYEEGDDVYFKAYQRERELKLARFQREHRKFIALEYEPNFGYLDTLARRLAEYGFALHKKSDEAIIDIILDADPLHDFYRVAQFFNECIEKIKSYPRRTEFERIVKDYLASPVQDDELEIDKALAKRQWMFLHDYFRFYEREIFSASKGIGLDYSDMIYFAKNYITSMSKDYFSYEHVIIDEYQDISYDRYELTVNTLEHGGAKLMAIGDDWQSIYGFTGSRVDYIYNFAQYYNDKRVAIYHIRQTHRFSDELAEISGEFIMRNRSQQRKELHSDKHEPVPIQFVEYSEGNSAEEQSYNELAELQRLIRQIHTAHPDDSIMVLARTNYVINQLFTAPELDFVDEVENRVSLKSVPDFMFDVRTIHKAKGATADWTIVYGLRNTFPKIHPPKYWLEELFTPQVEEEKINFAEERRVFYVALTRTKNRVFLLQSDNPQYRSRFIGEIHSIAKTIKLPYYLQ